MNEVLAHVDTKRATLAQVMAVPQPEFTKTWHPFSHAKVLNSIENAILENGMFSTTGSYSLSKDGGKMFGVIGLQDGNKDGTIGWNIGVRNSVNATLSIGICAGTTVFVCDNLAFSGDFVEFRKHTGTLDDDRLQIMANRSVEKVSTKLIRFSQWHDGLRHWDYTEAGEKVLTYNCMANGVFAPSKFAQFRECLKIENETNPNEKGTAYNFHGGVTRLMKNQSMFMISDSTKKLKGVIDDWLTEDPRKAA